MRALYHRDLDAYYPPLRLGLGPEAPLRGVGAYRSSFGGAPHWHLVTFGYSELGDPDEANAAVSSSLSGYGFEMTLRVPAAPGESEAPSWAIELLQNLAAYVFASGNAFEVGHHVPFNGPIRYDAPATLMAGVFAADPELVALDGPTGRVEFLQLVGVTEDEYAAVRRWSTAGMTALLREVDPALLSPPARPSILRDAAIARRAEEGAARDGSSYGTCFAEEATLLEHTETHSLILILPAAPARDLAAAMAGRLSFGRPFAVVVGDAVLRFEAGETTRVESDEDAFVVSLAPTDRSAVARLEPADEIELAGGQLRIRVDAPAP